MKVGVHLPDGIKRGRHGRAHHVLGLFREFAAALPRPDGDRDDDRPRSAARTARTAASMLAPVAIPSSTRITTLPRRSATGRPPRYARSRRLSSAVSLSITACICSSVMCRLETTLSFITTPPPLATAPIASSRQCGTPSLRTRKTSSGAPSAVATSQPTGTPPRGSPRTSASCSAAIDRQFLGQRATGVAAVAEAARRCPPAKAIGWVHVSHSGSRP